MTETVKRGRGRPKTPQSGMGTINRTPEYQEAVIAQNAAAFRSIQPITRREYEADRNHRRWEHTTLSAERPLTAAQYDAYGADGWELVSVYVRMDAVHAVFKREVV